MALLNASANIHIGDKVNIIISKLRTNLKNGMTPLHIAASKNDISIVRILLSFGSSLEDKTNVS